MTTHEQFIEQIGAAVQEIGPRYGIAVCSPIIAQAILESAWGASNKALFRNFFGLKYRPGRVSCHCGTFRDDSSEQLKDGTYIPITDQWYAFDSVEAGVEGYFQFIDTPNYAKLKGLTDPYTYLVELKAAGYATSQKYVENLWRVIQDNDLQRYDTKGATMANSSLATYANITRNHSGKRTARITKITPHYMAAYWTGRQCADYFAGTGRQASSNYCVGVGGDIAVSVPEDCRAWASSSNANDQAAVTIECGNNADSSLPTACYNALVRLCADICKRHGINPHYDGTPNGSITMHKMFASTACPGNWLSAKITSGQFERDIKNAMGQTTAASQPAAANGKLEAYSGYVEVTYGGSDGLAYHKTPSWDDSTIAGTAKKGEVFTIVGRQLVGGVYMYKLKSGYWITSSTKYVKYKTSIGKPAAAPKKTVAQLAQEVIAGKWGNGQDRVNRLKAAGYDPAAVQAEVNRRLG